MDHDFEYADSCHPDRIKLLGVELGPLRVGHQFLLKRIRSPFICDGNYGIPELLTALWYCSHTYAQGVKALYRKPFGTWFWTMRKTLLTMRLKDGIAPIANALADHIRAAHRGPSKVFTAPGGKSSSTPFTLMIFDDLSDRYTWDEFMEQPLRKVIIERFGILARDETVKWRPSFLPDRKEETRCE